MTFGRRALAKDRGQILFFARHCKKQDLTPDGAAKRANMLRSGGKPPAVARATSRIELYQPRFFPQRDRLATQTIHLEIRTDHHFVGMPREAGEKEKHTHG